MMARTRAKLLRAGVGLAAFSLLAALVLLRVYRPPPPPGRLIVRTVPAGVSLAVNGTLRGVTADTGLVLTFRAPGYFHLRLSRPGYATDTSSVWIGLDEVLEVDVVMKAPGMGFVRGGAFDMGSEDGDYNEKPVRRVYLDPFYMDLTEVTAAAYRGPRPEQGPDHRPGYVPSLSGDRAPAVNVSWEEARDYCRSLGKRLPTEAEWERACRGPGGWRYSYGNAYTAGRARTGLAAGDGPGPVGSYAPGSGGLFDMTGNVWEWCSDWYATDAYRQGPERNPAGPDRGAQRVLRGGAWYSRAHYSTCTHRPGNIPKERDPSFGFRCVKDAE